MGDEGVGVHAINALAREKLPGWVHLLDGGTGGFSLLGTLGEYEVVILIDASLDELEEGSLSLIEPGYSRDYPRSLSSHDIGLKDLIESAALLDYHPKIYLITVSVKKFQAFTTELSEKIADKMPLLIELVRQTVEKAAQSGYSLGKARSIPSLNPIP